MKNLKLFLLIGFVLSTAITVSAQKLLPAYHRFSKKKISHVFLLDGTEIKGNIKDIDRKKGLIKEIKIKDLDGKKHKFKAAEISHMYLYPTGFSKFAASYSFLQDATKWDNETYSQGLFGDGYVLFEQSEVYLKKNKGKKKTLLLQLLNPSFSSKIKIYTDPYAGETASLGFAGVKVAGGIAKSYYVKKGDDIAYRLKKKKYKNQYQDLYKGCDKLVNMKSPKWSKFEQNVFDYSNCD